MAEGAAQKGGALSSDAPSVSVADEAWKVSARKCGERGRLCFRQGRYALGRDRCGRGEPNEDRGAAAPACDDEKHCALGGPGGGSGVVGAHGSTLAMMPFNMSADFSSASLSPSGSEAWMTRSTPLRLTTAGRLRQTPSRP